MPSPAVTFHWLFGGKAQTHLHRQKKTYMKAHVLSMKPCYSCFCLFHQVIFGRSYVVAFCFFYAVGYFNELLFCRAVLSVYTLVNISLKWWRASKN